MSILLRRHFGHAWFCKDSRSSEREGEDDGEKQAIESELREGETRRDMQITKSAKNKRWRERVRKKKNLSTFWALYFTKAK